LTPLRTGSSRLGGETGQTLVEYALIIAVVSLGAIVALGFLSGKINELFSKAGNSLNTVQVADGSSGAGGSGGPPPPGPAPSGGNVNISCPGTCDDGDLITATTGGWSNSPTSYTFTWETSTMFLNGSPDACDPTNGNYTNSQGPTTQAGTSNGYSTPSQPGGTIADSIRVRVTATNANGTSSAVTDCVVVYN
jgi:Flp pilus assembly pilin Flp